MKKTFHGHLQSYKNLNMGDLFNKILNFEGFVFEKAQI